MRVTVLGSGTALPTARRASAGYLVEWDHHALLLDLAAGTTMRAVKAGLDPRNLRAAVITHLHPDHAADLAGLFWTRRQGRIPGRLVVAGPSGTADFVRQQRAVFGDWLDIPYEVRGFPCEVEGMRIAAFPARHGCEAVCLRLSAGGKTLAYSGDTGDCPGLHEAVRDADLAILECSGAAPKEGHMTPRECEAVVAAARPRRVLLSHLGPDVRSSLPMAEDGLVVCA